MTGQPDLFAALTPPCGECANLGEPIESGIRYCHGAMTFHWPTDRVEGCSYRGEAIPRWKPAGNYIAAIKDLLDHPRHTISEKGRKWLRSELRREEAA